MGSALSSKLRTASTKPALLSRWPKWLRWVTLVGMVGLLGAGTYFIVRARQTTAAASTTSTLQTATAHTGSLGSESGLGLAIAKSIVEAHGGSISAESEAGKGTQVKIVFSLS